MRRFPTLLATLLAALLVAVSCGGAPDPPDSAAPGTVAALAVPAINAGSAAPPQGVIPLSYLLKEAQAEFVRTAIGPWIADCGQTLVPQWIDNLKTDDWRTDNMTFTVADNPGTLNITFTGISAGKSAFDPILSTWIYGKTQIKSSDAAELPGSAYLLDNSRNATTLDFSQDESITLHQERSTKTAKEVSLDVGSKVTGSIGGETFGAKLETEVSVAFGIKTDTETAQSESTDKTTTRHIATVVEPARASLVTIQASDVTSVTPFAVNGVWESGITIWASTAIWLRLYDGAQCAQDLTSNGNAKWSAPYSDGKSYRFVQLEWDSWADFSSMINGFNTDWPHYDTSGAGWKQRLHGVDVINDHTKRQIVLAGVQSRTYQDAAEITIVDVTGEDLDKLIKDHGIDDNHVVVKGTAESGSNGDPGPAEFNAAQGAVPRFTVTDDGIYVLHDDDVIRLYDLVGDQRDFQVPLAYSTR